uniref:Uncharacterized protein n=1 Tax=Salmonella phage vB_SE130_2P TaxID=3236707 RepID=A0AB39C540_9VIRU
MLDARTGYYRSRYCGNEKALSLLPDKPSNCTRSPTSTPSVTKLPEARVKVFATGSTVMPIADAVEPATHELAIAPANSSSWLVARSVRQRIHQLPVGYLCG